MNKVITINLGGTAFQLEEAGYDALRAYLDGAASRLQGNPDREEIMADIERAIGEKFGALLNAHKNVVLTKEVASVLSEMGPIEDGSDAANSTNSTTADATTGSGADKAQNTAPTGNAPKRLYRIHEGAMIAGVCNGIAAYANIDPTIVRIAFVALTLFWGAGILVYLIMAFVVPAADSPAEKAAAYGLPSTAQEFIHRARQGYYDAMKNFPDRKARREWKRRVRQEMRGWRTNFEREFHCGMGELHRDMRRYGGTGYPPNYGTGVVVPIFSALHGALALLWICSAISLLATGALFGVALPVGLPVWAALLLMLFSYGFVVWPLKVARKAFYWGGGGWGWSAVALVDTLVWIAFVATLLWLALHYMPQIRDAFHNLPIVFRDGVDTVRDWWRQK